MSSPPPGAKQCPHGINVYKYGTTLCLTNKQGIIYVKFVNMQKRKEKLTNLSLIVKTKGTANILMEKTFFVYVLLRKV